MARDTKTYGFNAADADDLLQLIGGKDSEHVEGKVRGQKSIEVAAFSAGSGIAAISGSTLGSASCTKLTVTSGTRASTGSSETVYNLFTSAIGSGNDIIAIKINGIWVAIAEDCT